MLEVSKIRVGGHLRVAFNIGRFCLTGLMRPNTGWVFISCRGAEKRANQKKFMDRVVKKCFAFVRPGLVSAGKATTALRPTHCSSFFIL
jgi:hypothetical protein